MNIVYTILNKENGKVYIGSTQEYKKRIGRHFKELEASVHHCSPLQKDYLNREQFEVSVIVVDTREEAYRIEQELITRTHEDDPESLYNIGLGVKGGDNLTRNPRRTEIVENIVKQLRERCKSLTNEERKELYGRKGKSNGMYGRTHSTQARKTISEKLKGRESPLKGTKRSDEFCKKLSKVFESRDYNKDKNPFYGKKHTENTKEKLRNARLGNKPTNCKRVSIDGVVYDSLHQASTVLSVPVPTVHYRVRSNNPKFSSWKPVIDKSPTAIESP